MCRSMLFGVHIMQRTKVSKEGLELTSQMEMIIIFY